MSLFEKKNKKKMLFTALCCVNPPFMLLIFCSFRIFLYILLHHPTLPRSSNPTYNAISYSFSLFEYRKKEKKRNK